MSLIGEIEKLINEEMSSVDYRIMNIAGKKLYIEGIKYVINLSDQNMEFQLKKITICVKGNFLKIKYLDGSSVCIEGEIKQVVTQ